MRYAAAIFAAAGALAAAGAAQAASVELRDAVVRVTVVPEARADVKVEVLTPNPKLPIAIRQFGDRTVVDGGLAHRIHHCNLHSDRPQASVWGVGRVRGDEIPQVVIRTPRDVQVASNGVVFGAIGRSATLDLRDSGCSRWTIADVAGEADLRESGMGSIGIGEAGRLDLRLSGAAQIHAMGVRDGMGARLSGAGGVQVARFAGPMDARVSGVGHVRVDGGRATAIRAEVSGIGGVEFGGVADSLDASISGLGAVRVKQVTGVVTKSVSGGGRVVVGDRVS
jgi:hypothetical protein